jgi:hypothetical protein
LDDVPAVVQAYVGRWIQGRHKELASVGHRVSGTTLLVDRPLIYMCDVTTTWANRKAWLASLLGLTALRALEWREQKNSKPPVMGVGVRVMSSQREYSYVLVQHVGRMPVKLRRSMEWSFGVANFRVFETRPLRIGRNEPCPCGDGRKYKNCHGRDDSRSHL